METTRPFGEDEAVAAEHAGQNSIIADDIACPACGYDMRGISSEICPECGVAIDRAKTSLSRIPWEHRSAIGFWKAYWRTNLMALLRPRRLAEEMNRHVDFGRARAFRRVTVTLAWLPLSAWGMYVYLRAFHPYSFPVGSKLGWGLEFFAVAVGLLAIWLFLFFAASVGSYF